METPYIHMDGAKPRRLFETCCFCIPLRALCLFFGYVNVMFNIGVTIYIGAMFVILSMMTHGFDHVDEPQSEYIPMPRIQRLFFMYVAMLIGMAIVMNLVWLGMNVAGLVGLHMRRPNLVRWYTTFTATRVMLTLGGFIYVLLLEFNFEYLTILGLDIGLSLYNIMIHLVYVNQLEQDLEAEKERKNVYPQTMIVDKENSGIALKIPVV